MKPKWVATLNAIKFKAIFQCLKNPDTVFLMGLSLLIISCDKSDDLNTIDNEVPPDVESLIVYTDIEPDFTSDNLNDSYALDLNNDQIMDFTLSLDKGDSWEYVAIASNPIVENGILSVVPWNSNPVPLNSGREIFNPRYSNGENYKSWGIFTVGDCFAGEQGCFYDWKDKIDKYLGLRIIINEKTHYGWAQLDVVSFTQWVIKDYAYNATPNKPILAGQRN